MIREATSLVLHIVGLATVCRWAGALWRENKPYIVRSLHRWQDRACDRAYARSTRTRVWGSRP